MESGLQANDLEIILVLLSAAVFIVAVFQRLNLSPVLGYLVAGLAIGPSGLGIVKDTTTTQHIGEFGVVFLLFYIGLELTLERLAAMKKYVLGFGSLQMLLTGLVLGLITYYSGMTAEASIIIGGGFSLSSTAIVLQVLMERREQATQVGRLSLAVLIAQDLAVVPLLILVTLLAGKNVSLGVVVFDALLKAGLATVGIIAVGRLLLRPLFHAIGSLRSRELFAATTLFIVLGAAYLTEHFGLSLALGAFMAGLMVAETEYCHQVEADILPFKSLLLGLFFMTVGMQIDFMMLKEKLTIILLMAGTMIAVKALINIGLCLLFRFPRGSAVHAGLLLAQGGEFAFVLFGFATTQSLLPSDVAQLLMVTVTITMAVTPLLDTFGKKLGDRLEKHGQSAVLLGDMDKETKDIDRHIIVVGFGKVGRMICKILMGESITFLAVDSDTKNVHVGRSTGFPVFFGAPDRVEVLQSVGIERALAVIVTLRDQEDARKVVETVHKNYPDMPIIARGFDRTHVRVLESAGATFAVGEAFEVSIQLSTTILKALGVAEPEIDRIIGKFRNESYTLSTQDKFLTQAPENTLPPA
jgi:CPA2 family monovalent cation:H+ antiporter-2